MATQVATKLQGPGAAAAAAAAAAAQKRYDAVKVVEGMFNGSLACITSALQPNPEWIARARPVLGECSKKYQDALDDCEIQILDAKWYLEHKLAQNRAKREAAAKAQEALSNKRKHEQVVPTDGNTLSADSPSKRAKSVEPTSPKPVEQTTKQTSQPQAETPSKEQGKAGETSSSKPQAQPMENSQSVINGASAVEKSKETASGADKTQGTFNADDFLNTSPRSAEGMNDNDFTFDSMFNDSGDENNGNDVNFEDEFVNADLNQAAPPAQTATPKDQTDSLPNKQGASDSKGSNDAAAQSQSRPESQQQKQSTPIPGNAQAQSQTQTQTTSKPTPTAQDAPETNNSESLGSLLPGLEQFANQTDDNNSANNTTLDMNMDTAMNDAIDMNGDTSMGDDIFTGDFDIGPNIFDEAFQDGGDYDMQDIGDPSQDDINLDDFDFTT